MSTQEQRLYDIASKYGYSVCVCVCVRVWSCANACYIPYLVIIMDRGIPGGEENGKKGYMLTFVIAYIRVSVCVCVCVCVCVRMRVCWYILVHGCMYVQLCVVCVLHINV